MSRHNRHCVWFSPSSPSPSDSQDLDGNEGWTPSLLQPFLFPHKKKTIGVHPSHLSKLNDLGDNSEEVCQLWACIVSA